MTSASAPALPPRRESSLVAFIVTAFVVSWLGTIPMIWASYSGVRAVPAAVKPLQLLMLVGPGLVALAFSFREGGRAAVVSILRRLLRWRVSPIWYAAALLGPAALYAGALLFANALGVDRATIPPPAKVIPAFAMGFAAYLVLNTEELAWRGYVWPRMSSRLGKLKGALLLGVIWAVFHLPLFLLKGGHPAGYPPVLFGVMLVAFSVLFAIAYEGSGGSLLIPHLLHQSVNAWGDAVPVYPRASGSLIPFVFVIVVSTLLAAIGASRLGWRWQK